MTRSRARIAVALLSLGFPVLACRQPTPPQQVTTTPQATDTARRVAAAATANPDQARLWQEAADQRTAIGLDRVIASDRPVVPRRQPAAAAAQPNQPAPPRPPVVIPPGVETQLRVLTAPAVGPKGYFGNATVESASGDRLELVLGELGRLVVLARAAKAPIPVKVKEQVRLVYVPRSGPGGSQDVLVIRTTAGKGIGHVIQGGTGPVKMTIPLFDLIAFHEPKSSRVTLIPRNGRNEPPQSVARDGTVRLGEVFVTVVESYARTGSAAESAEAPPFLINLLVWSP